MKRHESTRRQAVDSIFWKVLRRCCSYLAQHFVGKKEPNTGNMQLSTFRFLQMAITAHGIQIQIGQIVLRTWPSQQLAGATVFESA
mmetsp:Transcript_11305/g.31812  ORF Transcript_11305/g.31812 Transcript_11305/m.31812 type:complete len:86 (-) Transcript_11305:13-270(-)